MSALLHAPPGQRIRAKVLRRDGHPLVKLEAYGSVTDLEDVKLNARRARFDDWAQKDGHLDVLTALASTRPNDRYFDVWRRLPGEDHVRRCVYRLRRGNLKLVGVVEGSWWGSFKSLQLATGYLRMTKRLRVTTQKPITKREGRVPTELRLAPGSRVRVPCNPPANEVTQ